MNAINKIMILIFTCLALSNASTNCFYYGDNPGAGAFGGAATGALIGGAAGGGRGAAIGAGVGAGVGLISSAAARDSRRRYDDDYYYDRRYRSSRRPRKYRNIEAENAELRARLQQYESGY